MFVAHAQVIGESSDAGRTRPTALYADSFVYANNIPNYSLRWKYPKIANGLIFEEDNGFCVNYVRALTGKKHTGDAIEWKQYINSTEPTLRSVVVFNIGERGHLGVVVEVSLDSFVVSERNYYGTWIVDERRVSRSDKSILGFIK